MNVCIVAIDQCIDSIKCESISYFIHDNKSDNENIFEFNLIFNMNVKHSNVLRLAFFIIVVPRFI